MDTLITSHDIARAWIGCLGCYNAGRLNGGWYDDAVGVADIPGTCPKCGSDEQWVFDMESDYFAVSEMSPAEYVRRVDFWADVVGHLDGFDVDAVRVYWDNFGMDYAPDDPHEFARLPRDCFMFSCDSTSDADIGMAFDQWLEDSGSPCSTDLPEPFRHAVDWESLGRDLRHSASVVTAGFATFVFGNY